MLLCKDDSDIRKTCTILQRFEPNITKRSYPDISPIKILKCLKNVYFDVTLSDTSENWQAYSKIISYVDYVTTVFNWSENTRMLGELFEFILIEKGNISDSYR